MTPFRVILCLFFYNTFRKASICPLAGIEISVASRESRRVRVAGSFLCLWAGCGSLCASAAACVASGDLVNVVVDDFVAAATVS